MALTTLPTVKSLLGILPTTTADDFWLTALLPAAEAIIKERIGRPIESASYTEFYSGNGRRELPLRKRPVTAVANVWQDYSGYFGSPSGAFASSTTLLTYGTDYCLDLDTDGTSSRSGLLLRINGVWSEIGRAYLPRTLTADVAPLYGNIKVAYTAGYTTIPQDLQYAVAYLMAFMKRTGPIGGAIVEERIGDYSYSLSQAHRFESKYPELGTVDQILSRYQETAIGNI